MSDSEFLDGLKDLIERAEKDEEYLKNLVDDVEELISEYDLDTQIEY